MEDQEQTSQAEPVVPEQPEKVVSAKADWRDIVDKISYNGIVKNVPFLTFLILLGIFYIANSHAASERITKKDAMEKELKELKWHHMDAKSKLMNASMEAELIRRGAGIGIKPLMIPAYVIEIDTNKTK